MRSSLKLVILAAFVVASAVPVSRAEIPKLLAWQGVALDSNNVPIFDSTYAFTFRIFDVPTGGFPLWEEVQLVTTENGVLNVLLGVNDTLPDTVFAGSQRYLEVQLDPEPPYDPRTRIVAVAYAFRVGTVDGASGGEIAGDIDLLDGLGTPTVEIGEDAAFGGGWFIDYSDYPTRGTVIRSTGTGNPNFYMVGDSSYVEMVGDVSGDLSVILPADAVSAIEMYNEPGLASSAHAGGTITTSITAMASATATFPTSGYVAVICEATFQGNGVGGWITGRVYENGAQKQSWWWDAGDGDGAYDLRQSYTYTGPVSAGTRTFELRGSVSTGTAQFTDTKVTIMFFPTSYGTVSSATVNHDSNSQDDALLTSTPVNVQAERDASIRANQERIERELADMKARMIELENQLRENAESQADER